MLTYQETFFGSTEASPLSEQPSDLNSARVLCYHCCKGSLLSPLQEFCAITAARVLCYPSSHQNCRWLCCISTVRSEGIRGKHQERNKLQVFLGTKCAIQARPQSLITAYGKANNQLCKISTQRKWKASCLWIYSSQTTALGLQSRTGGIQSPPSLSAKSQQKILIFLTVLPLHKQSQEHSMFTSGWQIRNGLWQSFVHTAVFV